MDAQVKGYLEAWGARLLHLAATDPQAYMETRYETDFWWSEWFTEHHEQIKELEDRVSVAQTQALLSMFNEMVQENPERRGYPMDGENLPEIARRLAPDAKALGDWIDAITPWASEHAMKVLMKPEAQ